MNPHRINKQAALALVLPFLCSAMAGANTLLYKDNFDTADTTNFDGAPLTGRLSGTLAATVFPKSAKAQQTIAGNQLSMVRTATGSGRIRFQTTGGWHNWAAGTAGTTTLTDGGMRVEFDWTPPDLTSQDWIALDIGHSAVEPTFRVLDPATDYGILFRNNGQGVRFDNGGSLGNAVGYTPTAGVRHVVIDFGFLSFADGTSVATKATVNGVQVASDTFDWNGDGGVIYMELEGLQTGEKIDNFTVSTLPPEFSVSLAPSSFVSGAAQGDQVGTLTGSTLNGGVEPTVFTLVAGTGATHNSRFQISGDTLEVGAYNFTQDPAGSQYSIRVRGVGSTSGGVLEKVLTLSLIKDDDNDGLLDAWELQYAPNLTALTGLQSGPGPGAGTGDFDGDGFADLDEFNYSNGLYPGISPILADSDGDGLSDSAEVTGTAGLRPATNPVRADTDLDGLSDSAESNTGTLVNASDTGSNPILPDTDGDGSRDGFEIAKGSNPVSFDSRPTLPTGFTLVPLTDDASSGISTTKTYTHTISGAQALSVNGVAFQELNTLVSPPNFTWAEVGAGNKAIFANAYNNWVPATGGVTGPGLLDLFDSFTYTSGGSPGQYQTYTLGGLTPGTVYQVRIYIRPWNVTGGSGRPLDLVFTNGATVTQPFGGLMEDRPGLVLNNDNNHSAYFLSYTYQAETTELVIKAEVHASSVDTPQSASGHFHLYGLSNEVVPPAGTALVITSFAWNNSGEFVIQFKGAPNTTYQVMKSSNLVTPFGPLTIPLTATTDASGVGQATIPSSEASEPSEFYRIQTQ